MAVAEYSALAGKTRAMFGKLLTPENYRELMRQRSVGDVAAWLKQNTSYKEIISSLNENDIRRVPFENMLKKSLLNDYHKLFCFSQGNIKEFLRVALLKYEVESVKRLFRMLEMEQTINLVEDSLLFLSKYDTLNIARLAKSRNSHELITNLQGTGYYNVLRPFLSGDKSHNLFHVEMALDIYYLNIVLSKKKKLLQGLDASVVERSIGTEIDVMNLLWVYRGRMIYNLDRSVILGYYIPQGYKLSQELVYELADAKDPEAFKHVIASTKYGELFLSDKHIFAEISFNEYMYKFHLSSLRKYSFSISSAVSYLHLKEYELSNIISILEGIRYHLPVEMIAKYIIGVHV
ncbi:MAG: V-type ATPase subunit [Thermoclostridium sp.]|nr:V-type ATPase subunit [Thermoclostridium sp.]